MVTRKAARTVSLAAVVVLIAVLGTMLMWHHNSGKAEAVGTLTVGLDFKTLSTDPGTYSSTLPTFEKCVDVNTTVNTGIFYIDVFILNTTQLQATTVDFTFNSPGMHIISVDSHQLFGAGTNVQVFLAGGSINSSGVITSPAGGVGGGHFAVTVLDTGGGHSGSGVMMRFKAQGNHNTGGNVINFAIDNNPGASHGVTLTDVVPTHPGDTSGNDGFFDGPITNITGKIAVDRPDGDSDGVSNDCDNCPSNSNSNQLDTNGDGEGDACDTDDDGDGFLDGSDNCPLVYNPSQNASACADADGDGVVDGLDNCPTTSNANQLDNEGDGIGDVCDPDDDNDGTNDGPDNCDFIANPTQADWNTNGVGDACEDSDGDGWTDSADNCKSIANASQLNTDGDNYGNICDNCPNTQNNDQTADEDHDLIGDACDDDDGDGWMANIEVFVTTNPHQKCASTSAKNDEPTDSNPLDNDDDRIIGILDVTKYGPAFNSTGPNLPYKKRLDVNADNKITITDVTRYAPFFNTVCTP